ncbi:MAG: thiol:disulfide interchange protein DsbA/DsbL [Burkholderiaceae bacterium]|jgi:thiol:disulfide interchange protein DsbA
MMNLTARRDSQSLLRHLVRTLLALVLIGLSLHSMAQGTFVEGKDYVPVDPPQPVENPGKVEVIFFFGYWCPHCNEFDPGFTSWSKKQGADVVIRHIPIAFMDSEVPLQRLFYTLDALGKEGELHSKVFAAIHQEQNPLNTLDLQMQFAQKNGIDPQKFKDLYNSFSVQSRVRRASQVAQSYGVDSVPFVTVDGKYQVPNQRNTFDILDFLVAAERKKMGPGKS